MEQERVQSHTSVIGTPGTVSPDNLLIMAYNINGIKNQLTSGCLRHLLQTHLPAVLCLGELKQRADRLSKRAKLLPLLKEFGYNSYHFHTHDEPKTGYSGTAILSRVPPLAFLEGWTGTNAVDDEGRVVTAIFSSFILVHTYAPSSGFDRPDRKKYRIAFETNMVRHVLHLRETHRKPVILMGDLNVAPTVDDVWDDSFNPERRKWPGCTPFKISRI